MLALEILNLGLKALNFSFQSYGLFGEYKLPVSKYHDLHKTLHPEIEKKNFFL